jgi:hypothetical protein
MLLAESIEHLADIEKSPVPDIDREDAIPDQHGKRQKTPKQMINPHWCLSELTRMIRVQST